MNEQGKPSTGQLIARVVVVLAALLAGAAIFAALFITRPQPKKEEPKDLGALVEVIEVNATSQAIEVPANGQVVPSQQIALSAEVAGRVVWLAETIVPGGQLRAGSKVARIDARDYSLALEQQIAQVDRANTELEVERNRKAIAEREWELLGGDKPANSVALRDPQMRTAQAALKAAKSGLQRARLSVGKTIIKAPFNAIVRQKSVDIGQLVGPQSPLVTLVGTDTFWVQVSIPMDRLKWIQIPGVAGATEGSPATVTQAIGDDMVARQGKVVRLLGDLDPIGRMARLLVEVPDPLGLQDQGQGSDSPGLPLLIGSYVTVNIRGQEAPDIVELSRAALRGGDQVYVMSSESTLEVRDVEVLWRKPETVLLGSGVKRGDKVIISPLAEATPGRKLRVQSASGSADKAALDSTEDPTSPNDQGAEPDTSAAGSPTVAKPSR